MVSRRAGPTTVTWQPPPPEWRPSWARRGAFGGVFLVVGGLLGFALGRQGDEKETTAGLVVEETTTPSASAPASEQLTTAQSAAAAATINVPVSVVEPSPVTVGPVTVPEPSVATPPPTSAPTTASPPPPEPTNLAGQGDTIVDIDFPVIGEAALLSISNDGDSNFSVWTVDDQLARVDLLVNTIGPYSGTLLVQPDGGASHLQVASNGAWTATLSAASYARTFDVSVQGSGDEVVRYTTGAAPATITHDGASNFSLWLHGNGRFGRELLVNEVGPYQGQVALRGSGLIEVNADGNWSVTTI